MSRPARTTTPPESRPRRAEERLRAAVGVHDPVRAHRRHGDRDMDHPGRARTRSTRTGSPIPGTYQEVDSSPRGSSIDSLKAPINGLYGIQDPATGNVDVFNSGELFGAIDVALFILVIGGFIGITMKTGAIQAGIALLVRTLRGHERLDDPDPDDRLRASAARPSAWPRRASPSTCSIITVMIAAGYDALVGASVDPARLRASVCSARRQPVRHRHRLRLRRRRR